MCILIHDDKGYVVNYGPDTVSVLDLKNDEVIKTIEVGVSPKQILRHGDKAYVVNLESNSVSVLDLKTDVVVKNISVGDYPTLMRIHDEKGYVLNGPSHTISVINLSTDIVVCTFQNPKDEDVTIIYPHMYLGLHKVGFAFDTPQEINTYMRGKSLTLTTCAYTDLLSPQEVLDLLVQCPPVHAIEMFLTLNQPLFFLNSPEGEAFCTHLSRLLIHKMLVFCDT